MIVKPCLYSLLELKKLTVISLLPTISRTTKLARLLANGNNCNQRKTTMIWMDAFSCQICWNYLFNVNLLPVSQC